MGGGSILVYLELSDDKRLLFTTCKRIFLLLSSISHFYELYLLCILLDKEEKCEYFETVFCVYVQLEGLCKLKADSQLRSSLHTDV